MIRWNHILLTRDSLNVTRLLDKKGFVSPAAERAISLTDIHTLQVTNIHAGIFGFLGGLIAGAAAPQHLYFKIPGAVFGAFLGTVVGKRIPLFWKRVELPGEQ